MSFGRRTSPPAPVPSAIVRQRNAPRRGGYWLGLLTVAVAAIVGVGVLSFVPAVNPTSSDLTSIPGVVLVAVINVVFVAAVVMALVDLLLRKLNLSQPVIYALACGAPAYGLMLLVGMGTPLFLLGMVFWPIAAGGWVMSLFRR